MDVITFQMGPGGIVDPQWQGVRAAYEHSLWAEGIGAGVRVGVSASLDAEAISALFAVVRRGACAVLLNPRDPEARRTAVCAQAGAASLPAPSAPSCTVPGADPDPSRPTVIVPTSGSSGEPRLIVHSAATLVEAAVRASKACSFAADDCWALTIPWHHVGGLGILMRAALVGARVAIVRSESSVPLHTFLLAAPSVTHASIVPTQLAGLLHAARRDSSLHERIRAMKALVIGGAPCPIDWRNQALANGWPLVMTYGMTETGAMVAAGRPAPDSPDGWSGRWLDGVVAKRLGADLFVRSPTMALGAWRDCAIEPIVEAGGWLRTNDQGRFEQGAVIVSGRSDRVFISGGENIDPVEVETQLLHHAALLGARVIGAPDDRWGMRPAAFVRTDGSAVDWDALVASLAERLPRHALPDTIVEWPAELPHKASLAQCHAALPSSRVLWSRPAPERSAVGEPADGVGHGH